MISILLIINISWWQDKTGDLGDILDTILTDQVIISFVIHVVSPSIWSHKKMVEVDYFNHHWAKEWATISIYREPGEALRKLRQVTIVHPCHTHWSPNCSTLAQGYVYLVNYYLPNREYNLVIAGFNTEMSIKCKDIWWFYKLSYTLHLSIYVCLCEHHNLIF